MEEVCAELGSHVVQRIRGETLTLYATKGNLELILLL